MASTEDPFTDLALPTNEEEAQAAYMRCVGQEERLTLVDNYVIEIGDGYGMIVDTTTCRMELNQLKKNALGGLLLVTSKRAGTAAKTNNRQLPNDSGTVTGRNCSTANITPDKISIGNQKLNTKFDALRTYSQVTIDNCLATHNQKFGVGVIAFYGSLVIKNSQFSENEEYGLVLSKTMTHVTNMMTTESNSSEILLDCEATDQQMRTP